MVDGNALASYQLSTLNYQLFQPDEHNQTDILTSGLTSLPPSRFVTSGLWEFVVRYSGATVPDLHGVPCHRAVICGGFASAGFKEQSCVTASGAAGQAKSGIRFWITAPLAASIAGAS